MNGKETDIQQVADTVRMIESTIGKRLMELYNTPWSVRSLEHYLNAPIEEWQTTPSPLYVLYS